MRIQKFGARLKKPYRFIAVMVITTSLLGISYGYWSDETTIKLEIATPKVKLEPDNQVTEPIIVELDEDIGSSVETFVIKRTDEKDSSIEIAYIGYEVLVDGAAISKGESDDYNTSNLSDIVIIKPVNKGDRTYEFDLNISNLRELLKNRVEDTQTNTIILKLNFEQVVKDNKVDNEKEERWKYSVEKEYVVGFITSPPDEQTAGAETLGAETPGDLTVLSSEDIGSEEYQEEVIDPYTNLNDQKVSDPISYSPVATESEGN